MDISLITPSIFWVSIILGAAAGFFGGLLGIGGGFILVPGFYFLFEHYFGLPPKEALLFSLGTAMASILITSLSATKSHLKHNVIIWPVFKKMGVYLAIGVAFGVVFATQIDTQMLKWIFALFCLYSGFRMVLSIKTIPVEEDPNNPTNYIPYGLGFGTLCGLIGVGGANLVVPFLLKRQATIRQAMATASSLQIPISIMGIIAYIIVGYTIPHSMPSISGFIYLPIFLISGVGIILITPIGVALAHSLPIGLLKRIFGVFAIIIGVHMTGLFNILPKPAQNKAVEQTKIVEDKITPDDSKAVTIQPVKSDKDAVSDAPIPVEKPQATSKKKKDSTESTKNKTTIDNKNIKPKAQAKADQSKPKADTKITTTAPEINKSPDYTPPKYEKSSE